MRFTTGSSVIPPLGLGSIKVTLSAESAAIYASTCINALKIPIFDDTEYETFKIAMNYAIEEDSFTSM